MTTWTSVQVDPGVADLYSLQSLGNLSSPATNEEDIADLGYFFTYNNPWDMVSSTSATWSIVYRHGDFGEGTLGGESFGGTAWTAVTKDT